MKSTISMGIADGKHKVDANDYLPIDGGELTVPRSLTHLGRSRSSVTPWKENFD